METLAQGLDADEIRRLFKLTDRDGSVLALVGERTIPVARLVGGRLRAVPLPMRLCYAGTVLTNDGGRFTHQREWRQAGAELLGAAGPVADAEVIALAARCLRRRLEGWQVDVGHAEFFLGLLDGIDAEHEVKQTIHAILARRDFVALERFLEQTRCAARNRSSCCASRAFAAAPRSSMRPPTWSAPGARPEPSKSWRRSTGCSRPTTWARGCGSTWARSATSSTTRG